MPWIIILGIFYILSSIFTIFAFSELKDIIQKSNKVKLLFNKPTNV